MNTFSERFIAMLAERELKQSDLPGALRVTKQTVNDWTKGRTQFPRPEHLFPLARFLGVEPEWLGTGLGQKYPDKRAPPDISEATKILTSMPEKDRVPYIEIIKRAKAA